MIGDWVAHAGVLLAAVGVLYLPGLALGAALRLRGLALAALAPVGSVALLAVLAVLYSPLSLAWTPLSAGAGVLVAAVAAWFGGRLLGPRAVPSRPSRSASALLIAGLVVGGVLGALRFGFYVGDPAAISQTNDAVFHLNALRWVLETGSASSFDLSGVIGAASFYPGAWHAVTALVVLGDAAALPVAVNMVSVVITALIWPIGLAWLTRVLTRGLPFATAATALVGALSASLLVFPLLMFQWGVLYPFALAVALMPAVLALTVSLPEWAAGRGPLADPRRGVVLGLVLLAAGLGALALAQPAVILVWALLAAIWGVAGLIGLARRGPRRGLVIGGIVAVALALTLLWFVLARSTSGSHWPPFRGKLEVVGDILLNAPVLLPAAWGISAAMIVGLAVAVRTTRLRWVAVGWLALAGLYAACAAIGAPALRRWLLGPWYADPYRLAALLPVIVLPLAAIGLAAVLTALAVRAGSRRTRLHTTLPAAAITLIAVIGAVALAVSPVVQMPKVIEGEWDAQTRYSSNLDSFLSPDERALLERLDEHVETDAVVIGNPGTGTGFGYLLSGRTMYPQTWAAPRTPSWDVLAQGLRDAAEDPEVCSALQVYGSPEFVLDFGPGEQTPGRYLMPGFTDFDGQQGFELVDAEGDASLWRITACAP